MKFILILVLIFVAGSFAVPFTYLESVLRHVRGPKQYAISREPEVVFSEYDFVIVGAGPAGCVLANRLSEIPEWKILLLEAGRWETLLSDIPMAVSYFQFTDFNWHYLMERQEGVCEAMTDGRCHWPRGRGVGGSSIINYMIYTRGNRQDFLDLEAAGNYGWGPNETLYYYMKSERSKLAAHPYSRYHGRDGYLSVGDVPYRSKMATTFLDATAELGNKILDYNGEDQLGFSYIQSTIENGRRCSAAKAFLRPVLGRKNLHVLANTRVTKILINPRSKAVYGVEFIRKRQLTQVFTRKEVILSSGAFNSPQLLMLSGIGPKEHLEELGIPVVQDLRVGKNLQDHISFLGLTFLASNVGESLNEKKLLNDPKYLIEWLRYGRGPLTLTGGVEAIGYVKTKYNNFPANQPDIELFFLIGSLSSDGGSTYRKSFHINDETYEAVYREIDYADCFTIVPMLLHPESKGELRLKSRDPFAWPKFYGNYLTKDIDVKRMVAGIREGIRIAETKAFKIHQPRIHDKPFPKCAHLKFNSDEYWECAVRMITATLHHQVGTCKMGPKTDPEAVVDPELRVHGIDFLRVADTSIIPKSWSAHTNAPSFMIGEKAADMIKRTWNRF
ncbi:glucose dehydrogenase [FAD, quinone]-like [Neodiprion fabricii]|uniref:glucose dehydrogenase [FAD, quinone]-like n=1 Tax=Neodiprion fabricii TaxID=2872261 RepID=UPI001ED93A54|nr:glucose dehydrogenase [FAD, quinone]-like [Neodiprion fabricii]XP_046414141.1 glucose dehydrogenase [FAD, quinone]-like [Neodiprion fabricii]